MEIDILLKPITNSLFSKTVATGVLTPKAPTIDPFLVQFQMVKYMNDKVPGSAFNKVRL